MLQDKLRTHHVKHTLGMKSFSIAEVRDHSNLIGTDVRVQELCCNCALHILSGLRQVMKIRVKTHLRL